LNAARDADARRPRTDAEGRREDRREERREGGTPREEGRKGGREGGRKPQEGTSVVQVNLTTINLLITVKHPCCVSFARSLHVSLESFV
jgi:hypothetical protein